MRDLKLLARRATGLALGFALAPGLCDRAFCQVKTNVPDVVAGARPARMYVQDLRQYRAIAIDVGDMDNLKAGASKLRDVLTSYGITHDFEIYSGTHEPSGRPLSGERDAVLRQDTVVRNGEAVTR